MPRFTLYGLYEYDNTLFDGVILPQGLDKTLVIDNILNKSGDLYLYYQVPHRAKHQITDWFKMHYVGFERMITALLKEYNPIENTDRYEDETINRDLLRDIVGNNTASGNDSLITTNTTDVDAESTTENKRSSFDSDSYSEHDKTDVTSGEVTKDNGQSTTSYGRKDDSKSNQKDDEQTVRSLHAHGNIGVMTNQDMIRSELELRVYNIYDTIAMMFENDILVQVY